jgi:acyl-CoA thioesterase-2
MSDTAPREKLGDWMRVERTGVGIYQAALESHFGESHWGDLLARCALAALAANPGTAVTALHADWLAAAKPGLPVALRVAALGVAAGRCEVLGAQTTPVCRVSASIAAPTGTHAYQDAQLPSGLPQPESLPTTVEYARKEGWPEAYAAGPVEFRRVGPLRPDRARGESSEQLSWLKLRAPLPQGAALEQAALIFLATFYDHWEFERRIGERFDYPSLALRSHALWIHRALRPEGWLLLRATSRVAAAGRALGMRELFAQDGALLATVVSEAHVG